MIKISHLLILILFVNSIALAQRDSISLWDKIKNTKSPETYTSVGFGYKIRHMKFIPDGVKRFVNLETLSLAPLPIGSAKPIGGGPCIPLYGISHVKYLPKWIGGLRKIKIIDLMNAYDMDYRIELSKISTLPNLEYLRISPAALDDELIEVLSKFTQLKKLCITSGSVIKNEQKWKKWFDKLRLALPNCNVEVC